MAGGATVDDAVIVVMPLRISGARLHAVEIEWVAGKRKCGATVAIAT